MQVWIPSTDIVNETHFNIEIRLKHIKITNKWLNNANSWILLASRCNHHLKFITTFGKDNKSLIYYITKTSIYISHMYYLLQITIQILPFGGINIMFMGEFLQFPPINDTPLYSTHIQSIFTFTKLIQKKIIGKKPLGELHSTK